METKRSFMMGLPESGKTTFLVAFTYMLNNRTNNIQLRLRDKMPDGYTIEMQEQEDRWASFQQLNRTPENRICNMHFELIDSDENEYVLEVPDSSGELYNYMLRDRYVEDNIRKAILCADEILFFLNFDKLRNDITLLPDLSAEMRKIFEQASNGNICSYDELPDQVKIVDLLQIVSWLRGNRFKVKFIISAWDSIIKNEKIVCKNPKTVIQTELPFVYQYVVSNQEWIEAYYWGVSAQGTDLKDISEIREMSFSAEPMQRVIVIDAEGKSDNDLSRIFVG